LPLDAIVTGKRCQSRGQIAEYKPIAFTGPQDSVNVISVFQKSAKKQAKYKATYLYRVKSTCFYPNPWKAQAFRDREYTQKENAK